MAAYIDAHTCPCALMHVDVWHRTLTSDTADAELYATYRCYQWTQLRCCTATDGNTTHHSVLRPLTYDDAVCMNAVIEINMLVAVRRRTSTYIGHRTALYAV